MPNKDLFMYMQKDDDLCVLDISKLLAWSSLEKSQRPRRPEFKLVHGSCFPDGRRLPPQMAYMIADSKSYIVGGRFPLQPPNLEVFACEPNPDDPEDLCKSNLPALSGPKFHPLVFTIEDKIYVLSTEYRGSHVEEKSLALFEVFNPISGSWKVLPNPPFIFGHREFPNMFAKHWCVWGHKIVISNWWEVRRYYIFNTHEEIWEDAFDFLDAPSCGFAECEGFLVGISPACSSVLTYKLDSHGIPRPYSELDELRKIFRPPLDDSYALITQLDDGGLMCILHYGIDLELNVHCLRLVVFQMLVSDYGSNQPVVHADIKAKQTYCFPLLDSPQIIRPSVFVTHDHSDKHDNKCNASVRKNEMPMSFPAFVKVSRGMRHKKHSTVPMMKLQPPRRKPKKKLKTVSNEYMDIEQLKALVSQSLEPRCWNKTLEPRCWNQTLASSECMDIEQLKALVRQSLEPRGRNQTPISSEFAASSSLHNSKKNE